MIFVREPGGGITHAAAKRSFMLAF